MMPSYFQEQNANNGIKGYLAKQEDGTNDLALAMFYVPDDKASSVEKFQENNENAILLGLEKNSKFSDVKIESHNTGSIAGLPSGIYTLSGKMTNNNTTASFTARGGIFLNSSMKYAVAYFVQLKGARFDYFSDFDKILASATAAEQTTSAGADGVSSDLKEMLDSYEAFMDDYIAFMQKYKNASAADLASMMADYSTYLQKYSDFTQKVNALDSSTMSNADAAYYIEVTSRVSQKLLNAAV